MTGTGIGRYSIWIDPAVMTTYEMRKEHISSLFPHLFFIVRLVALRDEVQVGERASHHGFLVTLLFSLMGSSAAKLAASFRVRSFPSSYTALPLAAVITRKKT